MCESFCPSLHPPTQRTHRWPARTPSITPLYIALAHRPSSSDLPPFSLRFMACLSRRRVRLAVISRHRLRPCPRVSHPPDTATGHPRGNSQRNTTHRRVHPSGLDSPWIALASHHSVQEDPLIASGRDGPSVDLRIAAPWSIISKVSVVPWSHPHRRHLATAGTQLNSFGSHP